MPAANQNSIVMDGELKKYSGGRTAKEDFSLTFALEDLEYVGTESARLQVADTLPIPQYNLQQFKFVGIYVSQPVDLTKVTGGVPVTETVDRYYIHFFEDGNGVDSLTVTGKFSDTFVDVMVGV